MTPGDEVQFFAATDVGRKRAHNEDNFLVDKDLQLFVVADGMGGHAAGEVASALAVRILHQTMVANAEVLSNASAEEPDSDTLPKRITSLLERGIKVASKEIHAEAQRDSGKRGMGTTLSSLLICGSKGYIGHVGDSRIYLVRGGAVHQITEDHTIANELLRLGMVTKEQLENIPKKNAITRAVGVYEHVDVDTLVIEVLPGDQFVLASDGFTGYLEESDADLRSMLNDEDGEAVVNNLIDFANELGGKDNVTTVLVRVADDDGSAFLRAKQIALKKEVLGSMPLFSNLGERELLQIMQVSDVHHYRSNETVILEGARGDEMFVTLAGRLRVEKGSATLRELSSGDHFGEMALIRSTARSATVTAIEDSEVMSIRRADFFDLIRSDTHFAVKLLWQFLSVLANRLEHTSDALSTAREELGDDHVGTTTNRDEDGPFSRPMFGVLETLRITAADLEPPSSKQAEVPPPNSDPSVPSTHPSGGPAEEPSADSSRDVDSESEEPPPELLDVRKTMRRAPRKSRRRSTLRSIEPEAGVAERRGDSPNGEAEAEKEETEESLKKTAIRTPATRKVRRTANKGDQDGADEPDEALLDRLRREYRARLKDARKKRKKKESD